MQYNLRRWLNTLFYILYKGMVELVPASDTLRKIQVEYGVTGSFKDKPLAEWLRKYNPTEEEYEKVTFFLVVVFLKILKRYKYHLMKE